tara:strand:- start:324 stop:581 length:258 start_codon:yes stop_codon:yes gene_type:complete
VWKFFLFSPIKFLSFHPNFSTSHFSSVFLFLSTLLQPFKKLQSSKTTLQTPEEQQQYRNSSRNRAVVGVVRERERREEESSIEKE